MRKQGGMSLPKMRTQKPMGSGGHRPRVGGLHAAFGGGGSRAFSDPQTMVAPDQAFGAAMAAPQGAPSMPPPPTPEG